MVKGNLHFQSSSLQPFFRLSQSSRLFAEVREWVVFRLISVLGGIISVKLHGFTPVETLGLWPWSSLLYRIKFGRRRVNFGDNFIGPMRYFKST